MPNILYQDKVLNYIDKNTLSTIPRTILLEGSVGSGRHLIANYIATKFNLKIEDISDNLSYEKIEEITLRVEPFVYVIDTGKLTIKNENTILKFLEEPLKNSIIILLAENQYNLIPTVRNRCYVLPLLPYSKADLKTFITNTNDIDIILALSNTPGDVLKLQSTPISDMLFLCNKIYDKIGLATYSNTLTLSDKLAFKNEKDKFDCNIFFRAMLYTAKVRVINNISNSIPEYLLTSNYNNRLHIKGVDKLMLFNNFLLNLKKDRGIYDTRSN